jgi:hypothetical protein
VLLMTWPNNPRFDLHPAGCFQNSFPCPVTSIFPLYQGGLFWLAWWCENERSLKMRSKNAGPLQKDEHYFRTMCLDVFWLWAVQKWLIDPWKRTWHH